MKRNRVVLWLACCLALAVAAHAADKSGGIAITHVNVIPMDREVVLSDQTVIVRGDRITQLGDARSVRIPHSIVVRIEGRGQFLMPALADMHTHLFYRTELPLYPLNGVMTVLNLDGRPAHLNWRREVADGSLFGPAIFSAGPTFMSARSPSEAVAEVDRQADAGYDAVKIYNQVSREEYPALIAEAKKRKLLLMGHVARAPGFDATLRGGQSIAHAEEYLYTFFNDYADDPKRDLNHPLDEAKIPQAVAMTRQAGIYVVPTLVAYHNIIRQVTDLPAYLAQPEMKYLPPSAFAALQPGVNGYVKRMAKEDIPFLPANYEFQKKLVRALHDGGVPLLAGTDSYGPLGWSLVEELQNLQDSGLTPFAAIQSATTNAAAYLHRSEEFGTVAVGRRADLILLTKNPLTDVNDIRAISGLVIHGRWISAAERQRLLASVPDGYERELQSVLRELWESPQAAEQYLRDNDPWNQLAGSVLNRLVETSGVAALRQTLAQNRERPPSLANEEGINALGYSLLAKKQSADALEVFRLNTELFPRSGNTYDSLAETYLGLGDEKHAKEFYEKALAVQPDYPNAEGAKLILSRMKTQ